MTTLNILIGASNVTDAILDIQTWRKSTEGIGRFALLIDNKDAVYCDTFNGQDLVVITLDGYTYYKGYVDIIKPIYKQDESNHLKQMILVTGRDLGQDEQNKFVLDKVYKPQPADDIIDALLLAAGSEITFTSPSTAPNIYFDSRQPKFLSDSMREILELIDYDGYVDHLTKAWKMFAIGSVASGITIKSLTNDATNNLLDLIHDEVDVVEVRNYILVYGGEIRDGWSEGNANGWQGESGNVITDHFATTPFAPMKGAGAIKCDKSTGVQCSLILDFPRYNHAYLDFRVLNSAEISFILFHYRENPSETGSIYWDSELAKWLLPWSRIELMDLAGSKIEFIHSGATELNVPEKQTLPVGKDVEIKVTKSGAMGYHQLDAWREIGTNYTGDLTGDASSGQKVVAVTDGTKFVQGERVKIYDDDNEEWNIVGSISGNNLTMRTNLSNTYYTAKNAAVKGTFTWLIKQILIQTRATGVEELYLDGLNLPENITMKAVAQDGTSQGLYQRRDLPLWRMEIKTQLELQAYADSMLAKKKDKYERIYALVKGGDGLISNVWKWLPGNTVAFNVTGPKYGNISGNWRMLEIHSQISRLGRFGFDHVVGLSLVPASQKVDTSRWSYGEEEGETAAAALLRRLHDRLRYLEEQQTAEKDWHPALPKPFWQIWGKVPYEALDINAPENNMIWNANFELDTNFDGEPDQWKFMYSGTKTLEDTGGVEGGKCVKLVGSIGDMPGVQTRRYYPVWAETEYVAEFMYKGNQAVQYRMRISCYDESKSFLGNVDCNVTLQSGWTKGRKKFKPSDVSSSTRYIKITIYLPTLSVATTAYVDSVWMFKDIPTDRLDEVTGTSSAEVEPPIGEAVDSVYNDGGSAWSAWETLGSEFKFGAIAEVKHALFEAKFEAYVDEGTVGGEVKVEYCTDGVGTVWTQWGSTKTVQALSYTLYTISATEIKTALNTPFWVRFRGRVARDPAPAPNTLYCRNRQLTGRRFYSKRMDI